MTQFPEHVELKPSQDDRVQQLSNLAADLGVLIRIDGMPYGAEVDSAPGPAATSEGNP